MTETRATYDAGSQAEQFTLTLSRLELVSLNRGLNCWLAELRLKRMQAGEPKLIETIDQAAAVAAEVGRRVDELLGVI